MATESRVQEVHDGEPEVNAGAPIGERVSDSAVLANAGDHAGSALDPAQHLIAELS